MIKRMLEKMQTPKPGQQKPIEKNLNSPFRDYAANYFFVAEKIARTMLTDKIVTMQFFQRQDNALLAGMAEVLEFLEENTYTERYIIRYLKDGTIINSKDVVLELEGKYKEFGVYEGIIDGILARATSIATNTKECIDAAQGKDIIVMSDRSDHYINQWRDGKAMMVAGIDLFPTTANAGGDPGKVFGSIPHALIQMCGGDVVKAMEYYIELYPNETDFVALVDYNNDVISDSLKVLAAFGKRLNGVRVDTSQAVSDKMFENQEACPYGVAPEQIKRLRTALDEAGGQHVRIVVSSGFDPERIRHFEELKTPVSTYGVGEYILRLRHSFSCDAVLLNGEHEAKVGRQYHKNDQLINYKSTSKEV